MMKDNDGRKDMVTIQCGNEDKCKSKDCLNCHDKDILTIELTHAEDVCLEDFGQKDLKQWEKDNPKQLELAQKVIHNFCKKLFNYFTEKQKQEQLKKSNKNKTKMVLEGGFEHNFKKTK